MSKKRKLAIKVPGSSTPDKSVQHRNLLIILIALTVILAVLMSVFLHNYLTVVHFTSTQIGSNVVDKRRNITYELAPMCYQPVEIYKKDVYARFDNIDFYKIGKTIGGEFVAADSAIYIGTAIDGIYDLYYNVDYPLPTLSEFEAKLTLVCMSGTTTIQIGTIEEEETDKLIDLFFNTERTTYPYDIDTDSTINLYIMSDKYPYFYFTLIYFKTTNGDGYIYDRSNGICINIGDTPLSYT